MMPEDDADGLDAVRPAELPIAIMIWVGSGSSASKSAKSATNDGRTTVVRIAMTTRGHAPSRSPG